MTNKDRCVTVRHFNGKGKESASIFQLLSTQTNEQVYGNVKDIGEILRQKEKYWQIQLFTTTHDTNSLTDVHCHKAQRAQEIVYLISL